MISANIQITFDKQSVPTVVEGYERTQRLLAALHDKASQIAPGMEGWFGGVVTMKDKPVPFSDRQTIIERLGKKVEASEIQVFSVVLATATSGKRKPNQLELHYMPEYGALTVSVYRPTDAALVAALLSGVPEALNVQYAFVDVYDDDPDPEEAGDKTSYRTSFATFPHRQCLGWMGYVPKMVTKEQLPLAADILPAKGGSIIVATREPFNLANKEHIKRANQIEMDMNDLGLLGVADPTF